MTRIKRRARWLLLLVLAALAGLGFYAVRLWRHGADWAASRVNGDAYRSGRLLQGTVTDRNGVVLAVIEDGERSWNESETVRRAVLHVVGDRDSNIGTGALKQYPRELTGYSFVSGLYKADGSGGVLTLSIDASLCETALEALDGRRGAVAVMNYETGEILCEVSAPGFDPENPEDVPEGAYLNRFLSASYAPGSTFKLVTAAAALENLPDVRERDFRCEGKAYFSGSAVTCMEAHGDLKLEDALAVSCNCVFAELAVEVGPEAMEAVCRRLGLLDGVSVDGIRTAKGRYDVSKSAIDTAWSGAGQSTDLVNPAAMLRFVSAIAAGGVAPGLTQLLDGSPEPERLLSEETAEALSSMMDYCVALTYGDENYPGLELHAKSGTAEVGGGKKPNAWFVGFLRNENAPLAFVVVIEEGGFGSVEAGFAANRVLQEAVFGV